MKTLLISLLWLVTGYTGFGQSGTEHMPNGIVPEQAWWNLLRYSISIQPDLSAHSILGTNIIEFRAVKPGQMMLLDLLAPMEIPSATWNGRRLALTKKSDGWLLRFPRVIAAGELVTVAVDFSGHPKEAVHPPWDGGWIWSKDSLGRPWISLACESPGGMLWFPCKNASYDEPDSGVRIDITVPDTLVAVGNGRLAWRKRAGLRGLMTWSWNVTSPMAGMEHQSGIAYGNGFENGYRGKNLSGTPWGLQWDFILVHESGHEWFGNSISENSWQQAWIHEGFTKYLETLYTTWLFGREAGNDYTLGIWKRIKNDAPIIGSGSSDEYNKGCAMLHMIRQIVGDTLFRKCLHDLNARFFHSTINTSDVLSCMNRSTGRDLSRIFAQYLTTTQVPVLEYRFSNNSLAYRWTNCIAGFDMPVKVSVSRGAGFFITPGREWRRVRCGSTELSVDRNFYVTARRVSTGD
jgi:aminopeptidase N